MNSKNRKILAIIKCFYRKFQAPNIEVSHCLALYSLGKWLSLSSFP